MRTFVIGDIHGRIEALKEVLKKSKFDYNRDKLIILGDVCDGGYNTYEVVEELLKIKCWVFIIGNHDEWFMNHISSGWAEEIWLSQGGKNTINSYKKKIIPITHQAFFNSGVYYHIENEMLFVHGGFVPKLGVEKTDKHTLVWDRGLIDVARSGIEIKGYKKIFIGHTPTQIFGLDFPIKYKNLIMMDCGAGWIGRLAIMDIKTEKYWLSELQERGSR